MPNKSGGQVIYDVIKAVTAKFTAGAGAGKVWTSDAVGNGSWASLPGSAFGDGSDGLITLDGATSYNTFSTRAGSVYTLTRDVYATTLTINNGVTLNTAGFRIFCTVLFANAGTTQNVGSNGNTGTNTNGSGSGGGGGTAGYFGGGGAGGQGRNASDAAAGFGGGSTTASLGAGGGAGGAGSVFNNAGSGGSATPPTAANGGIPHFIDGLIRGTDKSGNVFSGGGGGGGGGAGNASAGGGGGGGGGVVFISAANVNNTGTISVKGGNGGAQSGNGSNGGGGGGGSIVLAYRTLTALGTATVTGGTGGNNGASGNLYQYVL